MSILTPTYQRPQKLEVCKQSVKDQTDQDCQHFTMVDDKGIGIGGQYTLYWQIAHYLLGEYIFVLCDDDLLVDPDFVGDMKRIAQLHKPDVIMVRWQYGDRILPDGGVWENEPKHGHIGLSNWVVRGDVWRANAQHYANRYDGDFSFIAAIWVGVKDRIYWHDEIVIATQDGRGYGEPDALISLPVDVEHA